MSGFVWSGEEQFRLLVVIGSTRPGRAGGPIADWFVQVARSHGAFEVDVADLDEWDLPMLSEPHHPRLRRYEQEGTLRWSATVEPADAVVIVTPEYNYGYTAPVKNALDHLAAEWAYKAVGFVGYGGAAGGARAVQMLKQVVTTLRMTPVLESVYVSAVNTRLTQDGGFRSDEALDAAAAGMLTELCRVARALKPLRMD
jgi:NAD(P)H-dependent FMN reductase